MDTKQVHLTNSPANHVDATRYWRPCASTRARQRHRETEGMRPSRLLLLLRLPPPRPRPHRPPLPLCLPSPHPLPKRRHLRRKRWPSAGLSSRRWPGKRPANSLPTPWPNADAYFSDRLRLSRAVCLPDTSIDLPTCLPASIPTGPPTCLPAFPSVCPPTYQQDQQRHLT